MRVAGRSRILPLLIMLPVGLGVADESAAQSFGCHIGLRQQPRIWIYTDAEGARRHFRHSEISESIGAVLEDLAPAYRRRPYPVEIIRNAETRRLVEGLDLFSCVSGQLLKVRVDLWKLLKDPERPRTVTVMSVTFDLSDHSKLDEMRQVNMGPYQLLVGDPGDVAGLKAALSPIIADKLADCVFGGTAACAAAHVR